jgi:hypothetical protein
MRLDELSIAGHQSRQTTKNSLSGHNICHMHVFYIEDVQPNELKLLSQTNPDR